MKFFPEQVTTDFSHRKLPLNYIWRSKKVLFTDSSLEIFKKIRKKQGLCMLLRGDILHRGNPLYR